MSKKKLTVRMLAFSGVSIALAFVLSNIRLFRMPNGGSVTLLSMLFASLPGWFFGPLAGLSAAFAYGLLQFVTNPWALSFWQVMFDYIFAFTALGLSGFIRKGRYSLQIGYLLGIIGRFVFSCVSSLLFWTDYTEMTFSEGLWFSITYNGAYIGAEGVITLLLLAIPIIHRSLHDLKKIALKAEEK